MKEAHKVFCKEYVMDLNGTRAYKKAYPSCKTSTAVVNASKLLKKEEIKAFISEFQSDLSKAVGITAISQLLELKKIAYSNIGDYKKDWHEFKCWDNISDDSKGAIKEIKTKEVERNGERHTIKEIKLHDKLKALETINNMLGLNAPKEVDLMSELKFKIVQKAPKFY